MFRSPAMSFDRIYTNARTQTISSIETISFSFSIHIFIFRIYKINKWNWNRSKAILIFAMHANDEHSLTFVQHCYLFSCNSNNIRCELYSYTHTHMASQSASQPMAVTTTKKILANVSCIYIWIFRSFVLLCSIFFIFQFFEFFVFVSYLACGLNFINKFVRKKILYKSTTCLTYGTRTTHIPWIIL